MDDTMDRDERILKRLRDTVVGRGSTDDEYLRYVRLELPLNYELACIKVDHELLEERVEELEKWRNDG